MKPCLPIFVLCAAAGLPSCNHYEDPAFKEYDLGARRAAGDIATGRLARMDNIGIIRSGTAEMQKVLEENYGIESIQDYEANHDHVKGYNAMMNAAAKRRFGEDYYARAARELEPGEPGPLRGVFESR